MSPRPPGCFLLGVHWAWGSSSSTSQQRKLRLNKASTVPQVPQLRGSSEGTRTSGSSRSPLLTAAGTPGTGCGWGSPGGRCGFPPGRHCSAAGPEPALAPASRPAEMRGKGEGGQRRPQGGDTRRPNQLKTVLILPNW
jgi:hypothetical protein